jgi:hypothetical protein
MHLKRISLSALVAASFVVSSCGTGKQSRESPPKGTRLSASEAISIAQRTAKQKGWKITDPENPEVIESLNPRSWSILGSSDYGRIWIVVDDATGKADWMRGD